MALLRLISGGIEISAGLLMLKFNNIEKALVINSLLAFIGPTILVITTSIGLLGISDRLTLSRVVLIFTGVLLIIVGIRK